VLVKNFEIGAIKTGLLLFNGNRFCVAKAIRGIESLRGRRIPLVIDPVMIASSGDRLLEAAAIEALHGPIISARNAYHTQFSTKQLVVGTEIKDRNKWRKLRRLSPAISRADFVEGQAIFEATNAIDLLFHKNKLTEFSARFCARRRDARHWLHLFGGNRGRSCLRLGTGEEAIGQAKKFVTKSIAEHLRWTSPSGKNLEALRHFL